MSGRLVRGDDGRWVYLTQEELVEASDRRWAALVATSEADAKHASIADAQVAGIVRSLDALRKALAGAVAKKRRP